MMLLDSSQSGIYGVVPDKWLRQQLPVQRRILGLKMSRELLELAKHPTSRFEEHMFEDFFELHPSR